MVLSNVSYDNCPQLKFKLTVSHEATFFCSIIFWSNLRASCITSNHGHPMKSSCIVRRASVIEMVTWSKFAYPKRIMYGSWLGLDWWPCICKSWLNLVRPSCLLCTFAYVLLFSGITGSANLLGILMRIRMESSNDSKCVLSYSYFFWHPGPYYQGKTCWVVWVWAAMVKSCSDAQWYWFGFWNEVRDFFCFSVFLCPPTLLLSLVWNFNLTNWVSWMSSRGIDDTYRLSKCVQIARLYLEVLESEYLFVVF